MALQVWLPLIKDGDFLNKGIADISATNNGATFSANNGKIGSCYYLDGISNHYINTGYKTAFGTSDFTIAMWVKIPTITSGTYYAVATSKSAGANTVGVGIYWHYGNKKFLWSEATGSARYEIWTSETFTDIYDKWIHLVMIRNSDDEKKGYFYINGERHELASVPGIQDISTGTDLLLGKTSDNFYRIKAYYNDVRIYDHALSAKEVKEISKALVIHLKMDELSQDPISQIIYDSSGYGNNGTSAYAQQTFSSNTPRNSSCNLRTSSKSYVYCRINGNADYNNGNGWMVQGAEAMTVSEWAYATDWTQQTNCRLWSCTESGGWNTEGGSTGYLRIPVNVYTNSSKTSYTYKYTSQEIELASLTPGWHMFTFTYEQSYGTKVYVDGELHSQNPYTSYGLHYNLTGSSLNLGAESAGIASASSPWFVGGLSDFRLYYTALSAEDIKELYEVSASIDNKQNFYAYEFIENTSSQELLAEWNSNGYSNHTNTGKWSSYNTEGEWYLHGANTSFGTPYIPVSPTGKTYYYDMTLSVSAGNQAYVGICRFDANKGSGSNEGCIYIYSTKPASDIVKQRFFGTVNLGTTANGSNPLAYITLRVLNGWSGSTDAANAEMTIHNISLREVDTATGITTASIIKTGVAFSDSIREYDGNARITKNGFIEANELIEI